MSLFDSVKNAASQAMNASGAGHGLTALIEQQGGLGALLGKFEQHGLGSTVQSWIGQGVNQLITADKIKSVVGADHLNAIAQKIGMTSDELAEKVATHLPAIVDKLSPNGALPATANVQDALH